MNVPAQTAARRWSWRRGGGLLVAAALAFTLARTLHGEDGDGEAADGPSVQALAFLEGRWRGAANDRGHVFETVYGKPEGGVLLSMSKEFDAEGEAVFFEFEVFQEENGGVVLTPHPGGRRSKGFRWTDFEPGVKKARFENPEHDFPRVITYEATEEATGEATGEDTAAGTRSGLRITLDGEEKGEPRTWVLELARH